VENPLLIPKKNSKKWRTINTPISPVLMKRIPPEIRAGMTTVEAETEISDIAEITDFATGIEAEIPDDDGDSAGTGQRLNILIASPCCKQVRKLSHIRQAFVCRSAA
jgi:hypothetical protein